MTVGCFLTPAKLSILGETLVAGFNMEVWSKESPEQLDARAKSCERAHQLLTEAGINDPFFALGRTLLDLFRRLKKKRPDGVADPECWEVPGDILLGATIAENDPCSEIVG
ncbi:MAG: hypothetical protein WA705_24400 [Candidatus Ozemobacteraceae bacterium]